MYDKRNNTNNQKKKNVPIEVPLYLPKDMPDEIYNGILEVLGNTRFDKISFPLSVHRNQVSDAAQDDERVITAGYIRKYDQKNNKFAIVLFNGMRDKILALKDLAIIVNYTSYKDSLGTITKLVIVGDNSSTNTDEAEVASAVEAE